MRHRIHGKQLCLTSAHRRAMLRNLAAGLFEHGQIETTLPKAKAVQPYVEKLITMAKRRGLASRRQIQSKLTDRRIHAWVADPNLKNEEKRHNPHFDLPEQSEIEFNRYGELRKAPRLVQHLMTKVAPLFDDRPGGYTRIVKLGVRPGDAASMSIIELTGTSESVEPAKKRRGPRRPKAQQASEPAEKRARAAAG